MDETALITEGARALGVPLPPADATRLLKLLDELAHWNRRYNLTAIEDRGEMITHHLLDSLSVHGDLRGHTVADVGTGAGFPGLPLALTNPDKQFTLIDSNNKKLRFVAHAARVLELPNVTTLHARVGTLRPTKPFDTVVARAFAPLLSLLESVKTLCGPETHVLAMKGKVPREEIDALPADWRLLEVRALAVPGLAAARSLLTLALSRLS